MMPEFVMVGDVKYIREDLSDKAKDYRPSQSEEIINEILQEASGENGITQYEFGEKFNYGRHQLTQPFKTLEESGILFRNGDTRPGPTGKPNGVYYANYQQGV